MDPLSVGLFVALMISAILLFVDVRILKAKVAAQSVLIAEIAAKSSVPDANLLALKLENQTIRADIAEIKAIRRAGLEPARQPRPGSFRAFKNQMQGAEVEE